MLKFNTSAICRISCMMACISAPVENADSMWTYLLPYSTYMQLIRFPVSGKHPCPSCHVHPHGILHSHSHKSSITAAKMSVYVDRQYISARLIHLDFPINNIQFNLFIIYL